MSKSHSLCNEINSSLRKLNYDFSESYDKQSLSINSYKPVHFSMAGKSNIAGGSVKWIRGRHAQSRVHEPGMIATLEALTKCFEPIDVIFDVGALYGYFTLVSSSIIEGSQVLSFEMNPSSFDDLRLNVDLNPNLLANIDLFNCAISDKSQLAQKVRVNSFALRSKNVFSSRNILKEILSRFRDSIRLLLASDSSNVSVFEDLTLDIWSVDDFCCKNKVTPDLVKIDVEGSQSRIVPGCMNTFRKFKPLILLEFDDPSSVNFCGISNKQVVKPLFDMGYRLVWADHRDPDAVFEPLEWHGMSQHHECNSLGIFFCEDDY